MPTAWSAKDEHQYKAIKKSCLKSDSRRTKACPRIAASTVNKRRRAEGRTLSGLEQTARKELDVIPGMPGWAEALLGVGLGALIIWGISSARADEK
jgi:hypothetical protein